MSRGEMGNRPLRIAAEIRRDLPAILRKHVKIRDGLLLSVTDVEVTPDLSQAKVYFSVIGEREAAAARELEQQLNHKRGVIRTEIAHQLVMRQHPEFRFIYDETPARAARLESLLKQIQNESRASEQKEGE